MNYKRLLKILAVGLIAIFAITIIAFSFKLFGHSQYVVESGSMEPKILTGSVVFDQTKSNYSVGDVITFKLAGSNSTVTHRIVKSENISGQTAYIVKGDANNAPDPNPVTKANVLGQVSFSIPYVGYVVGGIKSLPGLILLILVPATIIVYEEIASIGKEIGKIRAEKRKLIEAANTIKEEVKSEGEKLLSNKGKRPRGTRLRAKKIILLLLIFGFGGILFQLSMAAYSSRAELTSISLQSGSF